MPLPGAPNCHQLLSLTATCLISIRLAGKLASDNLNSDGIPNMWVTNHTEGTVSVPFGDAGNLGDTGSAR